MHSMRNEAKLMNSAKLKRMGIEGKTESKMYGAEKMPAMMDTEKPAGAMPNRKRFNTGGAVLGEEMMEGDAPKRRLDKSRRGKGGSTVNIVIAPQGGADKPAAAPQPPAGMVAPPSPPPPPQPPGIPPQALAALAGAAGGAKPPAMMNRGGRAAYKRGGAVKRETGGAVTDKKYEAPKGEMTPADLIRKYPDLATPVRRATGGKVYDAGAGTGEGRIEKRDNYGKRAYDGEKRR